MLRRPSVTEGMEDPPSTTSSPTTAPSTQTSLSSSRAEDCEPIAIIGMGLRLPTGIRSGEQFWDYLINKGDGVCEVPSSRYNIDSFYHAEKPHSVRARKAFFLEEDPAHFDAAFFSISKHEAARLDPQQRLLLEVVWECLENSGTTNWEGKDIGCYVGVFGEDWVELAYGDSQSIDRYHALSTGPYALANRISYEYDIQGPSMTIHSGCSSSMLALHEACQGLYSGECCAAIVAGCNLILSPTMSATMSDNLIISPDGTSKTFDAAADGYGRGEAVNAIYIKKLSDAIADGDPVRAVIRATGTNSDGKTQAITTPGVLSQEALIKKTYAKAGISDITQTALFECHGTGTLAGDKTEASVVAKVCEGTPTFLGAVKPNVGHSEGASGITSIIKSVLSLEHRMIAPNINFNTPNPEIKWKEWNLHVPTDVLPWPENTCERISVNCFGIGGANAHAILESSNSFHVPCKQHSIYDCGNNSLRILVTSAKSDDALKERIDGILQCIADRPDRLHNLAHTLGVRRSHLRNRAFAIASTCSENRTNILEFKMRKSLESTVMFVFTGQGAQWPGMGKNLMETFKSFRDDIRNLDILLQSLDMRPNWRLEDELCKDTDSSRMNEAEIAQPACTAIQIGIINLFHQWGIVPAAVVGHSSGEIAAAYAAGAITARSAILTAYFRGLSVTEINRQGAMAVVALSLEEATLLLKNGVKVACQNSTRNVTISGDSAEVDSVLAQIKIEKPDVPCKRLRVNIAYHSDHMKEVGERYETLLAQHLPFAPDNFFTCPMFSTVTGKSIPEASKIDPKYWRQNLECPVLFSTAVQTILKSDDIVAPNPIFIEIGPHAALSSPLQEVFRLHSGSNAPTYLSTLSRESLSPASQLLETAAESFSLGINVDLLKINGPGTTLTELPVYPWDHEERHWKESRLTKDWRHRAFSSHELLGSRSTISTGFEPTWRNLLSLDAVPWLHDHLVQGELVFPGAAYVCMAGEAVQQLVSGSESYSVRHIVFKTPLILREFEQHEIVTTLRPVKLNILTDSEWFEFSITVYDSPSDRWVKHAQGQVRAGADNVPSPKVIEGKNRSVQKAEWYNILDRWGLGYRGPFQGLSDISADPLRPVASATVSDDRDRHTSRYLLHPAAIDSCLQLLSVASTSGQSYRFDQLAIPAGIEELYIGQGSDTMTVEVLGDSKVSRSAFGQAIMINSDGKVALSMTKIMMAIHEDSGSLRSEGRPLAAEIEWKPWLNMLPRNSWFPVATPNEIYMNRIRTLAQICSLYILETADRIQSLDTEINSLQNWKQWVLREHSSLRNGAKSMCKDAANLALLETPARKKLISDLTRALDTEIGSDPIARCMELNFENCIGYMQNKSSPMEVLKQDDLLRKFYTADRSFVLWENFLALLGHQNPNMRVLEIGGGTGAATSAVLKFLRSGDGVPLLSQYTFTDVSAEFTASAESRFAGIDNVGFQRLDITKDVEEQGFVPHSFDLIIASNVIHETSHLKHSLERVHDLLSPDGYLLLHELDTHHPFIPYVFGVFSGWWAGEDDGRADWPLVSPERWDSELKSAGFTGVEAIAHDTLYPHQLCATMISKPVVQEMPPADICLLTEKTTPKWAADVEAKLAKHGFSVSWTSLEQQAEAPSQQDTIIISLLDLNGAFFDDMTEKNFLLLQRFFDASDERSILWVTPPTQISCSDPRYALTNGFFRALRHEMPMDVTIFEVDEFDSAASVAITRFCCEMRKSRKESHQDPDYEFALRGGTVYSPRVHWRTLEQVYQPPQMSKPSFKIGMETYGLLDSFKWVPYEGNTVIEEGSVEIEVHYTALNFKDMMIAMGILGSVHELGLEGSGVVTGLASDVKDIKVGDRVAFVETGSLRSSVTIPRKRCCKIPDECSMVDGAGILVVYSTVFYSLIHVASLREGQTILIHSACGGVGLAAIQVCRQIGAVIYATVGSEEKVEYLVEYWGIPRNHIFSSRCPSFLPGIMDQTAGRGVDVVLNSLSGDLLRASWKCVAEFGKMIELGKRDLITHGNLDLTPFLLNRVYCGVDLIHVGEKRPDVLEKVREQCLEWYREGKITSIRPVTVFPASDISLAFRHMQQGSHMGKVVIDMRKLATGSSKPSSLNSSSNLNEIVFMHDASYLLVGGLGGIGKTLSAWMVDNGARNLVFLSPSAGKSKEDQEFIEELKAQGCAVTACAGSVSKKEDVEMAIDACLFPIKGVVQLSARLRDRTFKKMPFEDWEVSLDSKVRGTWNLHHALLTTPLDFFLIFSSICSITGLTGQSNYAAANSFLDSFAVYRQQLGLPASIINPGVIEHRGLVSRDSELLRYAKGQSFHLLQDRELIDGVRLAMGPRKNRLSPLAIGMSHTKPLSELNMKMIWPRDARFSMYANLESSSQGDTGSSSNVIYHLMARVQNDPRILLDPETEALIRSELGALASTYVPGAENMNEEEIANMTPDSLMSVEVRRWIQSHLASDVTLIEIHRAGTIGELACITLERLKAKHGLHTETEISESSIH
ncbi:Acyl transferase/acyl hydrolase/lysophospholipase [Penicillium herquei]|nr:Acyl transferase/acyl hydrolase/lysophospholipase [Penicillium herquei]